MVQRQERNAAILVSDHGYSYLLMSEGQAVMLIDSHMHGDQGGGLVAVGR